MEDAAGFFANVFGGERFKDYVSGLPSSRPSTTRPTLPPSLRVCSRPCGI